MFGRPFGFRNAISLIGATYGPVAHGLAFQNTGLQAGGEKQECHSQTGDADDMFHGDFRCLFVALQELTVAARICPLFAVIRGLGS